MPAPLDPEKREHIEQAIRAGGKRNQIARDHGVSAGTVSNIARRLEATGSDPAFDRSETKRACADRSVDLAERRTAFAVKLQDAIERIEVRMWEEQTVVVATQDGIEIAKRPTDAGEFRNFMTAIGIGVDKIRVLTDGGDGAARAASLLERLMEHVDAG